MRARTAALLAGGVLGARALRRRKRQAPPGSEETGEILRGSRVARALDPFSHLDVSAPVPPSLPEGRVVTVPGRGEMFVRTLGEGPGIPVLLLHGWMASADLNWYRLYEELAGERPVIACDHRGHGRGYPLTPPLHTRGLRRRCRRVIRDLGDRASDRGRLLDGRTDRHLVRCSPPGESCRCGAGGNCTRVE